MTRLHSNKVALSVMIKVPGAVVETRLQASPQVVGEELALQIDDYVCKERLGYYPALDFFGGRDEVDQDLLDAARRIAELLSELVCDEVRRQLQPVFSLVECPSKQPMAFTMPKIRPNKPDALSTLAQHFTPDTIKLGLLVTSIQKHGRVKGLEKLAERKLWRWLNSRFEAMEITSSQVI